MPVEMTFTDGLIQVISQMSPTFLLVCVVFIVLSWVRVLVDTMSGRGL